MSAAHHALRRACLTVAAVATAALLLSACTPTYNWRETRPAGPLGALLPCKPEVRARQVDLAGSALKLTVAACQAGGLNWGLSVAELPQPQPTGTDAASPAMAAMAALETALAANLGAAPPSAAVSAPAAPAASPPSAPRPLRIDGHDPDGGPLWARSWVWARDGWVAQATVLGRNAPGPAQQEAIEAFANGLDGLR